VKPTDHQDDRVGDVGQPREDRERADGQQQPEDDEFDVLHGSERGRSGRLRLCALAAAAWEWLGVGEVA